jgi:hypothetical protein
MRWLIFSLSLIDSSTQNLLISSSSIFGLKIRTGDATEYYPEETSIPERYWVVGY